MLLVTSSCPDRTILDVKRLSFLLGRSFPPSSLHNESHWEDEASKHFQQARIVCVYRRRAALNDFRKKPAEGKEHPSNNLNRERKEVRNAMDA